MTGKQIREQNGSSEDTVKEAVRAYRRRH